MPKIQRRELPKGGSVGEALMAAREACLPDEIRNDHVAQWILSHDGTQDGLTKSGGHVADYEEHRDPSRFAQDVLARVASDTFRRKIPLFFASLLHLGRVWEVSSRALSEIEDLEADPVEAVDAIVAKSILEGSEEAGLRGANGREEAHSIFLRACSDATRLHIERVHTARGWWKLLRNEAEPYLRQKERLDEAFSSQGRNGPTSFLMATLDLISLASEPSAVMRSLRQDGVAFVQDARVDSQVEVGFGHPALWLALVVSTAARQGDGFAAEDLIHRWMHLQEARIRVEKERLLEPSVDAALAALRARHGEAGPFLKYHCLGAVPSVELWEYYRQHQLPNGRGSPWREQWESALPTLKRRQSLPHEWSDALSEHARLADSTVRLASCWRAPALGQQWSEHLQYVFEERYVAWVALEIAKPRDPVDAWTVEAYSEFLVALTARLSLFGYSLRVPTVRRLERLFTVIREKGYVTMDDWRETG